MNTCKKCGLAYEGRCRPCQKSYMKKYRTENVERISEIVKSYYENNKNEILQYHQEYGQANKSKIRKYQNDYEKKKRLSNPAFKLRKNCSALIRIVMKGKKSNSSILDYLPYTMEGLKQHLENQFDDKMTWNNYGSYWHVDHVIPQSKLLYTSMEDDNFKKCWALENLRPLEAIQNMKKSNKVINVG